MPDDPLYIKVLEKLGVNVTRLRWKLYKRNQRTGTSVLPRGMAWLRYRHKICPDCGAVVDRTARACPSCERRMPSMLRYRISRMVATLTPTDSPVVINVFLGVMIAVYGLQLLLDGFSFGALMRPSLAATYVLGSWSPLTGVSDGQFWRFLSCGLVHGGIIHIGFNGFALTQIGPLVEQQIERTRMLVLITLSQLGSIVASYIWQVFVRGDQFGSTVGASGWLFGLIGYGIVFFHQRGTAGKPIRDQLLRWAAMVLVLGYFMSGTINNAAHVGGMLAGMACVYLPDSARRGPSDRMWNVAYAVCVALWVVTLVFMIRFVIVVWPQIANS